MARKTHLESLKTRQHLIDVAINQFATHGVSMTTLADIADAAGLTRGAIYWHFNSKAALFNEIWNEQKPLFQEVKIAAPSPHCDDALQLFRCVLISSLQYIATNQRQRLLLKIVYQMCEFNGEMYKEDEIRKRLWFHKERLQKRLQQCIAQGKIPADSNVDMICIIIRGYFCGLVKNWLMQPEDIALYERAPLLVDNLLTMIKNGCR